MMIKNIIFDLGNVIIKGTHSSIIKRYAKNEEEKIFIEEKFLKSPEWKLLETGMISNDEAIIEIQKRNDKAFYNLIETTLHEWYKNLQVNESIVDIAKKLKSQDYKIYVLSNMAEATYLHIKEIDFFGLCDGIVISAYEKIKKPDEKIFKTLLERYNLKAEECLFIDDDDTNRSYITANKLGILGRRVEPNSEKDIIKLLNEFNIKI